MQQFVHVGAYPITHVPRRPFSNWTNFRSPELNLKQEESLPPSSAPPYFQVATLDLQISKLLSFQSSNPSFRFPGFTTTGSQFLPSTFSPSYTSAFPFPPVSSPSSTTSATSPFPFPSSSSSTSPSSYTAFPFPSSSAGYNPLLPQQPLPRQDSSKEGPRMHNGKKVYKLILIKAKTKLIQVRSARTIYSASQIHQLEAR